MHRLLLAHLLLDMEVGTEGIHDLWQDGREVWANGRYFTELVTERAVEYVRRAAGRDRPFFLYVSGADVPEIARSTSAAPDRRATQVLVGLGVVEQHLAVALDRRGGERDVRRTLGE